MRVLPVVAPGPVMMLATPGGKVAARSWARRRVERGGELGGFADDAVAGGQGGGELPGGHHQRVVPGGDAGDDADRVAAEEGGVAWEVFAGERALLAADGAGEETKDVEDGGDFVAQDEVAGFAGVEGFQGGVVLGGAFDAVGEGEEQGGALGGGGAGPGGEGGGGGGEGGVDLGGAGRGDFGQGGGGAGVQGGVRGAGAGVEGSADEQVGLHEMGSP